MLEISDISIDNAIKTFANHEIEAAYLVPTATGLEKSIQDAHAGIRTFLKTKCIHDYNLQHQGADSKKIIKGFFVLANGLLPTKISLYRPETKNGDPRICIYGLKQYANPRNLLAMLCHEDAIYVINLSDSIIYDRHSKLHPEVLSLIDSILKKTRTISQELFEKIKLATQGSWIKTLRPGPTGIGFTLETLLGINANSNRAPDYKGIEIKSTRAALRSSRSRITLFSKTPDWRKSNLKHGLELLDLYGYYVDGRKQIYCSLNNAPNSLGHYLKVDSDDSILLAMHAHPAAANSPSHVFHWDMSILQSSIEHKHKETFWVKAQVRNSGQHDEEFLYHSVIHTKSPFLANVPQLFKTGKIELDYLLHEVVRLDGSRFSRDHGYLFKIWGNNLNLLFPPPKEYSLI